MNGTESASLQLYLFAFFITVDNVLLFLLVSISLSITAITQVAFPPTLSSSNKAGC